MAIDTPSSPQCCGDDILLSQQTQVKHRRCALHLMLLLHPIQSTQPTTSRTLSKANAATCKGNTTLGWLKNSIKVQILISKVCIKFIKLMSQTILLKFLIQFRFFFYCGKPGCVLRLVYFICCGFDVLLYRKHF